MAKELQDDNCYVALTHDHLDAKSMMNRVRSPKAGAIVLFAGCTPPPFAECPADFPKELLGITSLGNQ
jgi:molybdopterin synthase catalytic subunit